jgi:hypothetical protein
MRHHRLQPRAWLLPLGLAIGLASCAESTGIGSYTVTYRANATTIVKTTGGQDSIIGGLPVRVTVATLDSVTYSNGTSKCITNCNSDSTLVKVNTPAATYSTELVIPSGSIIEGHLYGKGTAAGTAQFTVIWMTASGGLRGDSVTVTTAPGNAVFKLDLSKRTL